MLFVLDLVFFFFLLLFFFFCCCFFLFVCCFFLFVFVCVFFFFFFLLFFCCCCFFCCCFFFVCLFVFFQSSCLASPRLEKRTGLCASRAFVCLFCTRQFLSFFYMYKQTGRATSSSNISYSPSLFLPLGVRDYLRFVIEVVPKRFY